MSLPVRFEPEADIEYREAGQWYEERRTGLGAGFFDAVDALIRRIAEFPDRGAWSIAGSACRLESPPARPGTVAATVMQNRDHDRDVFAADEVQPVRKRVEQGASHSTVDISGN